MRRRHDSVGEIHLGTEKEEFFVDLAAMVYSFEGRMRKMIVSHMVGR